MPVQEKHSSASIFSINGANNFNKSGIFLSFEETPDKIYKDVASLNLDLKGLVSQKKIYLEHVLLQHKDIHELGFNLEGISAQAANCVDFVLSPKKIAEELVRLGNNCLRVA